MQAVAQAGIGIGISESFATRQLVMGACGMGHGQVLSTDVATG